jgi:flagellin-like protein
MKFNKKAQSEIITTVLIILLVLAAIIIVWQVIQGTVKTGTDQVTKQSSCMGINLDIAGVVPGNGGYSNITVTRKPGADDTVIKNVSILVGGAVMVTTALDPSLGVLQTKILNFTGNTTPLVSGNKIEVGAVLSDGTKCDVVDSMIA